MPTNTASTIARLTNSNSAQALIVHALGDTLAQYPTSVELNRALRNFTETLPAFVAGARFLSDLSAAAKDDLINAAIASAPRRRKVNELALRIWSERLQ